MCVHLQTFGSGKMNINNKQDAYPRVICSHPVQASLLSGSLSRETENGSMRLKISYLVYRVSRLFWFLTTKHETSWSRFC